MRIAVIGGGPGGLYFAALARQLDPDAGIDVWERNAADDTFGFGVVFSDETLGGIEHADPAVYGAMAAEFARWDDIDVHYRGRVVTSGGHGFAALSRVRLLQMLQRRCAELGVRVRFLTAAPPVEQLTAEYDLVVAADGVRSATRTKYADHFRPSLETRTAATCGWAPTWSSTRSGSRSPRPRTASCRCTATPSTRPAQRSSSRCTSGSGAPPGSTRSPPGSSPPARATTRASRVIGELFADMLAGHSLIANNSRWVNFTTVRTARWSYGNVVLLGDAAHTAHFSIGSGTKLAMEDALALAACLRENPDVPGALAAYEAERRPVVASTQRAAQASLEWFEDLGRYVGQEPLEFAFNLLTRSRRVTYDNLRLRDPEFVAAVTGSPATAARARPRRLCSGRSACAA